MMQPIARNVRYLGRTVAAPQRLIQSKRNVTQIVSHWRNSKVLTATRRHYHHKTEPGVITSTRDSFDVLQCTISEYVWKRLDEWPDKTAVVCGITGKGYTYGQAHRMSNAFAACLRNKLGLRDGDCVGVMLPNSPEFPLAILGGLQAGCIVTTINPIYTKGEVVKQIENSEPKAIITTASCHPRVVSALEELKMKIPIIIADCHTSDPVPDGAIKFAEFAENFGENTDCLKDVRRTGEDIALMPYSSGTTGLPKGVQLSHNNITSNCIQARRTKIAVIRQTTATFQEVIPCVLPFYHIYGLVGTMISILADGLKIVTLPSFVPQTFLDVLEKHKPTLGFLVPPIVLYMGASPDVKPVHLETMRTIFSGAAPLVAADVDRFLEKAKGEIAFQQAYGLTETSPLVLLQERGSSNYGSVGEPAANTDVMITNLTDNKPLGPNEEGELWVRGPQVMKGYYKNDEANDDVFRPDGWLRTGDLSYYDENHNFYITDRLKELIKVKGYQVAPAELEGILRSHPDIEEAAVIGLPHPFFGEIPQAYVIRKKNSSLVEDELMKFLAEKVASYKKLGGLEFVTAIPKNPSGKILRREVKKMYSN